ncbi:hypothetical protein [uncultured Brachyspira sp.]|nr:hypothetical protein [uncultured Brachyspira sp.]
MSNDKKEKLQNKEPKLQNHTEVVTDDVLKIKYNDEVIEVKNKKA